jgi:hypothetical protein
MQPNRKAICISVFTAKKSRVYTVVSIPWLTELWGLANTTFRLLLVMQL